MFLPLLNSKTGSKWNTTRHVIISDMRIEGVFVSVLFSYLPSEAVHVMCSLFPFSLVSMCENIFCSFLFLDDEKRKKHRRKKRSGSKPEPIVWKKEIENFHNIYAELGRLVSTTRFTREKITRVYASVTRRLNKNMTRVTAWLPWVKLLCRVC